MRGAEKKNNKMVTNNRKNKNKVPEVMPDLFKVPEKVNRFGNYVMGNDSSEDDSQKNKKNIIKPGKPDVFLIFIMFALITIGLIMILSSSYYRAIERYQDGTYFFIKQLKWAVLGFVALFATIKVFGYKFFKRWAMCGYWFSIVLLISVIIFGSTNKGATRWFEYAGFSVQPSEIAKIFVIVALAFVLSKRKAPTCKDDVGIKSYAKVWLMIAVPSLLIFIENLSTGIIVAFTGLLMVSISGFKLEKWFVFLGIPLIIGLVLFIKVGGIGLISGVANGKYKSRLERFEVWLDPWEDPTDSGFQIVQSLYAIGSGGIFGVGLGKSKQKLGYIPEAHNDIIFAIICEEFGLVGATVVLALFIILIMRCINIAIHAPDKFSMYYVIGMTSLIALQVIVNVGVVTNSIPATGMPLPFISYGGTSLLLSMVGMGIILNVSRYTNRNQIAMNQEEQQQ